MEYEGNVVSAELKKTLKEATDLRKKTKKEYNAMQEEISNPKVVSGTIRKISSFSPSNK